MLSRDVITRQNKKKTFKTINFFFGRFFRCVHPKHVLCMCCVIEDAHRFRRRPRVTMGKTPQQIKKHREKIEFIIRIKLFCVSIMALKWQNDYIILFDHIVGCSISSIDNYVKKANFFWSYISMSSHKHIFILWLYIFQFDWMLTLSFAGVLSQKPKKICVIIGYT